MAIYIKRAAVIGAGVMGAGIAALLTGAGIDTLLIDIVPPELTDTEAKKGLTIADKAVRNRFADAAKERMKKDQTGFYDPMFALLMTTGNLEDDFDALSDCDLVIEAVVEDILVKRSLMQRLNEKTRDDCIVASNTSGLPIGEIAQGLPAAFKRRFLGAHFFNPPRFMRLLELIPTGDTDPEIISNARAFFEKRLGKSVIIAKDTPGFVGNRIGIHAMGVILNTAQAFGYDVAKVDSLTGKTLGRASTATFKTADLVGIDLILRVSETQSAKLNDPAEREEQALPPYVEQMVQSGLCGNKTGKGFYKKEKTDEGLKRLVYNMQTGEYDLQPERGADKLLKDSALDELLYGESDESRFLWQVTKKTLLNCARRVPEISDDYRQIDVAMRKGFNWQWGPFELWDKIGLARSVNRMRAEGDEIPAWIMERVVGETPFYSAGIKEAKHQTPAVLQNRDAIVRDIGDGVLCASFATKANTLTSDVAELLADAVDSLENGDYRGLVIHNEGQNFSVGANLNGILELCNNSDWKQLERAILSLQNSFIRIKYSKKPIVTVPHGMTLGGGTELVLHAPFTAAYAETYMGLVEAGVGLIPAGGGTKECLFQTMEGHTDRPLSENINRLVPVFETIAMGKVSANAHQAKRMRFLQDGAHIIINPDSLLDAAKAEAIHQYEMGYLPRISHTVQATGVDGYAALSARVAHLATGGFISEYDAHIARKLAYVLSGGSVICGDEVEERYILALEREAFLSLCGERKTQERMAFMIKTGKPLRN